MRLKYSIFLLLLILCFEIVNASPRLFYEYSFIVENKNYLLVHYWSMKNTEKYLNKFDNPLSEDKNAFFMLIDKRNGKTVYKKRSGYFTYGWISPDSNYIILLSNIERNIQNTRISLFSIEGKLLFKSPVNEKEIVLNFNEYVEFKNKYPVYAKKILKNEAISASNDMKTIYIDPFFINNKMANNYLKKKLEKNHYLNDCVGKEAFNQFKFWFYQRFFLELGLKKRLIGDPIIKLIKNKTKSIVVGISLLNSCKKRITIPITKKNKNGILLRLK